MLGKVAGLQGGKVAGWQMGCRLVLTAFMLLGMVGVPGASLLAASAVGEMQGAPVAPDAPVCEAELYHGVQHCAENGIDLIRVDLSDPHVRLQTVLSAPSGGAECNSVNPTSKDATSNCPAPYPFETLDSMLQRYRTQGAVAAINSDYFGCGGAFPCGGANGNHGAQGLAVRNGVRLDGPAHGVNNTYATTLPSLAVSPLNAVTIGIPGAGANIDGQLDERYYNTVAGSPLLVKNGVALADPCSEPYHAPYGDTCNALPDGDGNVIEAQSAGALAQDNNTLLLATANLNAAALASYLVTYGSGLSNGSAIASAIKFDGGGSARIVWLDGAGTMRSYSPTGGNRPVAQALLVFSDKIATQPPGIAPNSLSIPLNPGQSFPTKLTVSTGASPIDKGDVLFVFDRTGSMTDEIEIAKSTATSIMNEILAKVPNTWFGVAGFMDYPADYQYPGYPTEPPEAYDCQVLPILPRTPYGCPNDLPWQLNLNPTADIAQVAKSINDSITLGNGADWPESYSRMLYELRAVNWRAGAKKIAVVFGDAPAHDLNFAGKNYGGDPGPDGIAETADDLDFETVVQQVRDAGITVIAVNSHLASEFAAPTFKGMSIGYEGAVGTRGQYFELQNTAQLPFVTANLILAENSSVDELTLRVTEGYETWIQATPAKYEHVGAYAAKEFQFTVQVPAGTPPGFYPFLIQAIGDGAILGVTPVEVIVPSPSATTDLGFRPNPNGYGVVASPATPTWEMFRQLFGSAQVQYSNGNRIHAADVFYQQVYANSGANGNQSGLALTSIFNYLPGSPQPNAGTFAMPKTANLVGQSPLTPAMRDAIAFAQAIPTGLEIGYHKATLCTLLNKSPTGMFNLLRAQLAQGSPSLITLSEQAPIAAAGTPQARVLLPYRIVTAGNQAEVFVYDPDFPSDENRKVLFQWSNDRTTDSWNYMGLLQGDKSICKLVVTPLSRFAHRGVAWWKAAPNWPPPPTHVNAATALASSLLVTTTPPAKQLYSVRGVAALLLADDKGRRIGWEGATFYDEIPDATFVPVAGVSHPSEGLFYLPSGVATRVTLHAKQEGSASIDIFGEGYLLQIAARTMLSGTVASIQVDAVGERVTLAGESQSLNGSIAINRLFEGEDRTVRIQQLQLQAGERKTLSFRPATSAGQLDTILFQSSNQHEQALALSLQHSAQSDGYRVLATDAITLPNNGGLAIAVDDWSKLETTTLTKLDSTGNPLETMPAINRSVPATMVLESPIQVLEKEGEQMNLSVAIYDPLGAYVTDGTPVTFTARLGDVSPQVVLTSGGRVSVLYQRDLDSGDEVVTVRAGEVQFDVKFVLLKPTALPDSEEPSAPKHFLFLPVVQR